MKIILKITLISIIFILLLIGLLNAQTVVSKADKYYSKLAYAEAIAKYEKIIEKNPNNLDVLLHLCQCYKLTNNKEMLEQTYLRMMKVTDVPTEQKYNYAITLISNGKYEEAKKWMSAYYQDTKSELAKDYLVTLNNIDDFYKDTVNYIVEKLPINSLNADFSPALYKDGIVFASSRLQPGMITREHTWTGQPFLSLYYSKGREGDFRTPESFGSELKSKFNDGPVCFNKTGEIVYVTRNNIENGTVKKSNEKIVKLKIFEAQNSNGVWKKLTNFPYNSNEYNCGHPCLSPDENQLYFSSDMPGGYGGMDLYVCRKENGKWSKPVNLGPKINTTGNDIFPYIHDDKTLFFASDGHLGMGGLDIYSTKAENNVYASIKNMGAPINSHDDDFALIFDNKNKTGYFSSNREHRGTDDDIYSFSRTLFLKGIVVNKKTGESVEGATVTLNNSETGTKEVTTLNDGKFAFPIDFDEEYIINGMKVKMGEDSDSLNTEGMSPADNPFVKLELENLQPMFTLRINVIDEQTREPIEMADLKLNHTENLIGNTNQEGIYRQDLASDSEMNVMITKSGYSSKIVSVSNKGLTDSKDFVYDVELRRGKDLLGFENWNKIIYYDLDKYNIRPKDAIPTMEEVLAFMKENPEVIIKLNSHTDSRASKQYNILLSQRRAISAKNFLVDHGISANRIGPLTWTGETILVNKCADNVYCPEADHQLNRRTEITVIDIDMKKRKNKNK